jgi:hypothetical protein
MTQLAERFDLYRWDHDLPTLEYFIDHKRYAFPITCVELRSTCIIADIILPSGQTTTIANSLTYRNRVIASDGTIILKAGPR